MAQYMISEAYGHRDDSGIAPQNLPAAVKSKRIITPKIL
jgi:hypothetical protein